MVNDLNKERYSKFALPLGKIKVPKYLYIFLIVLIILILIISGFYFYLKNNPKKTTTNKSVIKNEGIINKTDGLVDKSNSDLLEKMSKDLILWLEKQRDDRGVYSENEICENGVCNGNIQSNRSGFSVLSGEVRYEKKINQHIIDDLKKYSDKDKVQVIQSNYLLCNFLYDIYNYPNASEEAKNLTEKICFDSQYEIFNDDYNSIYVQDINTEEILNQNLSKLERIVDDKEKVSSVASDNFNILNKYGYYASEFATRYKWKNKEEDYKGFLVSVNKFLDLYGNKSSQFADGEVCSFAWGLADIGEYKNLLKLRDYGRVIYKDEVSDDKIAKMTLKQALTCGLAANRFNDKDALDKLITKTISAFYNKEKGCIGQQSIESLTNIYDVKNNGIFLFLLNSKTFKNE